MKHSIHWSIFGTLAGAGLGNACVVERVKSDHCAQQDGDGYCMRRHGEELGYCARGSCDGVEEDGCVAERPSSDACYSPCGGGLSLEDDLECDAVAEGSSSSDSGSATLTVGTTEPTGETSTEPTGPTSETENSSSTTASGCVDSSECGDPASPICVGELCVSCSDDAECQEKDPSAPACREGGQCVACTASNPSGCGDATPVCDDAANACVGCSFHEQCPESACRISTGGCFDTAAVHDVGAGMEFERIGEAVSALGEGGEVVLRVFAGADYNEAVTIGGAGTAYAILADDDAVVPQWVNTGGGASTLRVEDGAEVYVQSLRFAGNLDGAFAGITANASSVYLDRTQVGANNGGGIALADGADGHLRNCFVGGFFDMQAMTVDGSSADVLYTSLGGSGGISPALACTGPSAVTVRNSVLVSRAAPNDDLACDDAEISYSATELLVPGMGNVALGDMDMVDAMAWFAGYNNGNFALNNPPPEILTAAQWRTGDPPTDIGSELRPTVNAIADVAGADVP